MFTSVPLCSSSPREQPLSFFCLALRPAACHNLPPAPAPPLWLLITLPDPAEETHLLFFKKDIKGSKTSYHLSPGGLAATLKHSLSCKCMKVINPLPLSLCHPGAPLQPAVARMPHCTDFLSALCSEKLLLFSPNLSKIFNEHLKQAPTFSLPPEKQGGKHMGNMQPVLQNNNEASGNFSRKRNGS